MGRDTVNKVRKVDKRLYSVAFLIVTILLILPLLVGCGAKKQVIALTDENEELVSTQEELEDEIQGLKDDNKKLKKDLDDQKTQNDTLINDNDSLSKEVKDLNSKNGKLEKNNKELQAKIDEAKPWFELSEIERQKKAEELQKQKEAEAEAERLAKEAEAKKGYETGITFEQLARTPDDYKGQKVKFRGKVIQVIEGKGETQLRIAVNRDYDKIILVAYDSSIVTSRVLDDDTITIMGTSAGLYSYESTSGATITIPAIVVDMIEFK